MTARNKEMCFNLVFPYWGGLCHSHLIYFTLLLHQGEPKETGNIPSTLFGIAVGNSFRVTIFFSRFGDAPFQFNVQVDR